MGHRDEKERRSLEHTWITVLDHILSPPGSTGVGGLNSRDLIVTHFFQQLLDGVFCRRAAMLGKFKSLI